MEAVNEKRNLINWAGIGIIVVLFFLLFKPTFHWMILRFTEADTYYSHGFLVPLFASALLYMKRKPILETRIRGSYMGLIPIAVGLLLHLVCLRIAVNIGSGIAMLLILSGIVQFLFGTEMLKKTVPAIVFLLFMIPIPNLTVIFLTFHLKMLTARLGVLLVNIFGFGAIIKGSFIFLDSGVVITIGDPCSGLRSLLTFVMVSVFLAMIAPSGILRKINFVLLTLPVAFVLNVLRASFLIGIAKQGGANLIWGPIHSLIGFAFFLIFITILFQVSRWLLWKK